MPPISKLFPSCAEQIASSITPSAVSLAQLPPPLPSQLLLHPLPSAHTTGFRSAGIISKIMKHGVSVSCFSSCFEVIYKRKHKHLYVILKLKGPPFSMSLFIYLFIFSMSLFNQVLKTPTILPSATTNI